MTVSEAPGSPDEAPLLELYKLALDEYRFQVNLNWTRTEHWFTLNAAVAGTAIALLHFATHAALILVAAIFLLGALASFIAVQGVQTQHGYYRQARSHKKRIEDALELGDLAITTTPGMGRGVKRSVPLHLLYMGLLVTLGVINLGGAAYAGWQYDLSRGHPTKHHALPAPPAVTR